jgi:flagellar M-ring protein FliF
MGRALDQLLAFWVGLTRAQQLLFLLVGGGTLAVVLGLVGWNNRPDFVTLYASLRPEDAGAIVEQLKSQKVQYKVSDGGTRIQVPAGVVHEARLRLASHGLPSGGGVGFEIFDRASLGMTDFVQKLNYQRALQGELSRTIGQLREVTGARVHLVIPQPSLFLEKERVPTASVVVSPRPGARLGPEQIRAIIHLVSASVEGLDPDRVTVVDTNGRVLSPRQDRSPVALSASQLEYRAGVEAELQRRVQSMLEEVLGPNKATVRVAAQLDFTQVERTEEKYDPNTVVRSEHRSSESSQGSSTPAQGAAGAASNVAAAAGPAGLPGAGQSSQTTRENELITYEVGKVVERRTVAPGEIKRLSVGLILDGAVRQGGEGAEAKREYVPRKPEELEKIRKVVMQAVGYNPQRGDEVEVAEIPFDTAALERDRAEADRAERSAFWWGFAWPAVYGLGFLLVFLFVVRPILGLLRGGGVGLPVLVGAGGGGGGTFRLPLGRAARGMTQAEQAAIAAQARAELDQAVPAEVLVEARKREELHGQLTTMAKAKPDDMVQLVRTYMAKKPGS